MCIRICIHVCVCTGVYVCVLVYVCVCVCVCVGVCVCVRRSMYVMSQFVYLPGPCSVFKKGLLS